DQAFTAEMNTFENLVKREQTRLTARLLKHSTQKEAQTSKRYERFWMEMIPTDIPQERFYGPVYFWNAYGPTFYSEKLTMDQLDWHHHSYIEV
ncbi:MAG: hypothetical protein ACRCWQ_07840, partial [Bacilli bacterium]